jgi:hypothetical protein
MDIMVTGKIFSDAGLVVPESLREAMAVALQAAPPEPQGVAGYDIISSLLEVADEAGQNPFDVYDYLNSLLASVPSEACIMLLCELVAGKKAVIAQAVAGFMLHPDAVLAQSVAEALAASATRSPVESSLIERLVRLRPWPAADPASPARRHHRRPAVKCFIAGQNRVAKGDQVFCLGLRWVGHAQSRRHSKSWHSLPTCQRHDEACRCCRCCGASGPFKIRNGRDGSSTEVRRAGEGNRFSWSYPDVGPAALQIGRGGGESRPWPGSSRSSFAPGHHYGPLG